MPREALNNAATSRSLLPAIVPGARSYDLAYTHADFDIFRRSLRGASGRGQGRGLGFPNFREVLSMTMMMRSMDMYFLSTGQHKLRVGMPTGKMGTRTGGVRLTLKINDLVPMLEELRL